jgi:hypothetical protein
MTMPYRLTKNAVQTIVDALNGEPCKDESMRKFLIELLQADLNNWDNRPLMSEEEIRQYRPHPGPVGGIGSPPKE